MRAPFNGNDDLYKKFEGKYLQLDAGSQVWRLRHKQNLDWTLVEAPTLGPYVWG